MILKPMLLVLFSLLLLKTQEAAGNVLVAIPKKSPVPAAPPLSKPVPAPPLPPSPPVKKPTPSPPAKISPPPSPVYNKPVLPPPSPPVKKPTPPPSPPAKVPPSPPTYKPAPPTPVKPSPPPPPPRPRTTKDCIPLCEVRCKLHSRKKICLRACVACCDRCKCVPPGQYGQKEKCGACYVNMKTHGGRPKCP